MLRRLEAVLLMGGRGGAPGASAATLAVVLGVVMLLTGTLAVQAWRSSVQHRAVAEDVLHDYASLAAWNYTSRVRSLVFLGVTPVLGLVSADRVTTWAGAEERMRSALDSIRRCECAPVLAPRYYFRIELAEGGRRHVSFAEGTARGDVAERLAAVRAHALERTRRGVPFGGRRGLSFAVIAATDTASWMAFYTVRGREPGLPEVIDGFEATPASFAAEVLASAHRDTPFFPNALVGPLPNDSIASLAVVNASRTPVYRPAVQYPAGYSAERTVFADGASDDAFAAVVTMNPTAASRLLIGGVPRSPLPAVALLLTATIVLIGVAFILAWRASDLARQRTDFTSSVSHELRTPLTQILLYGEMLGLRRTRSERERGEAAHVIVREARRLIHLVENVLHFSRAERRIVRVTPRAQPLEPIVRDVVASFAVLAEPTGTRISTDVAPELAAWIDADALRHVLLNLLDNALRYGGPGQTIAIGAARIADHVVLHVEDAGPGVPPDDRERIWQPFVRLERDVSAATTGSGIGLAVVRELVTSMGGTCAVESAPTGGARFVVRLSAVHASASGVVLAARSSDHAIGVDHG